MPPLTTYSAAALVGGGGGVSANTENPNMSEATPPTVRGKVLRPFYFGGKPLEKDKEVDLPRVFATEMIAANKLELVKPKPAANAVAKEESQTKENKDAGK